MDFHSLSRRDLQTLCKKNRIPANITNVAMAEALQALEMIEGIEELQEALKFQSPKTNQRTASRKPVGPTEDQASPLPGSRRVTARAPGALKLSDEEEEKKDVVETLKAPNTTRRSSKKEEGNEIVETPATRRTTRMSKKASAIHGAETQKDERPVGLTTGPRRRGTVKKEVDLLSGGVRSSRVRGIRMASLAKEEVKEEKEAGEVVVETTEENVDDKLKEQEEETTDEKAKKVDDKAEEHEEAAEVDDKAENQEEEKVVDKAEQVEEKGAGDIVDQKNDPCYEDAAVEAKNEEIIDDVAEQAEEKQMKDIVEEEIKSFDQTSFDEGVMAEDGDFVDQTNDLQSEEMKTAETKQEDKMDYKEEKEVKIDEQVEEKLDDKAEEEEEKVEDQLEEEEEKIDDQSEEKLEVQVEEVEEKLDDKPEQEEEKQMKDIVGEEIKSFEQTSFNEVVMAEDGDFVDRKNDIQSEEMKTAETKEDDKMDDKEEKEEKIDEQVEERLDDKAEEEEEKLEVQVEEEEEEEKIDNQAEEKLDVQVEEDEEKVDDQAEEKLDDKLEEKHEEEQTDDQAEQEEEKEMKDTVEDEIKYPVENTCHDQLMAADEESVNQKNVLQYEEMTGVETIEEVKLDDVAENDNEKLEVDDVTDKDDEKLGDKPEQEEEQIDDQVEQEEKEMNDAVENEITSPVENTCYDLLMAADEESVNQKNILRYEEMAGVETVEEVKLDDVAENNNEKLEVDVVTDKADEQLGDEPEQEEEQIDDQVEQEEKEMNDAVEEEINSLDGSTDAIIFIHVEEKKNKSVEECSELVEAAAIINEDSPIRGLITSVGTSGNAIAEEVENVEKSSKENEIDEEFNLQEQPISEESKKETGNIEIGKLIPNLSELNISSSKEEIKVDAGVLWEENDNKENTTSVKSKTEKKNYKDMSLRQLRATYKEVLITTNNKGEEKRAALKVIQENRI